MGYHYKNPTLYVGNDTLDIIIISSKSHLFSPWYLKICSLDFKQQWLTQTQNVLIWIKNDKQKHSNLVNEKLLNNQY